MVDAVFLGCAGWVRDDVPVVSRSTTTAMWYSESSNWAIVLFVPGRGVEVLICPRTVDR